MNLVKVGEIHTPYQSLDDCPSNVSSAGAECILVLEKQYEIALTGLKAGQKILVLYWLDQADRNVLLQANVHTGTGEELGTFALRSPFRPNPIGASQVTIDKIEGHQVFVKGLDCLHGTCLLDIKPC